MSKKCPVCGSSKGTVMLITVLWNAKVEFIACRECDNLYVRKELRDIKK